MNTSYKPDYVYTGNFGKYWDTKSWDEIEYRDSMLLDLFDKFNEEMFNNELKRPHFLIFSKFCFKRETINTFGFFQFWKKNKSDTLHYGIYISIEEYLILGQEQVEDTLKHEMIHAYLEQNNKGSHDSHSDFIYMCGWHHVSLFGKSLDYHPDMKEVKVITKRYSLKFE